MKRETAAPGHKEKSRKISCSYRSLRFPDVKDALRLPPPESLNTICIGNNLCHINVQIINGNSEPPLEALNFRSTLLQCLGISPFFSAPVSILNQHLFPSHDPGTDASGCADCISSSGLAFVCHAVSGTWYLVEKHSSHVCQEALCSTGCPCCLGSSKSLGI